MDVQLHRLIYTQTYHLEKDRGYVHGIQKFIPVYIPALVIAIEVHRIIALRSCKL